MSILSNGYEWLRTEMGHGLPVTQKRLDANVKSGVFSTDPMLQWAGIILVGASIVWFLKKV